MKKKISIIKLTEHLQELRNVGIKNNSHKYCYNIEGPYHIITHMDDNIIITQIKSFDNNIKEWLQREIEFWS